MRTLKKKRPAQTKQTNGQTKIHIILLYPLKNNPDHRISGPQTNQARSLRIAEQTQFTPRPL